MSHPYDLLADYATGDLSADEARAIEAHLQSCASCRAEVRAVQEAMVAVVESLPPVAPPEGSWEKLLARVRENEPAGTAAPAETRPKTVDTTPTPAARGRRPRWQPLALAASVLLAAVGAIWGFTRQQALAELRAEQTTIARWLARPDVQVITIPPRGEQPVGSVMLLPDGRALLVLRDPPPPGRSYQVWGMRNGEVESLAVISGRTAQVRYESYERLGISLEPAGGSPNPTDVLGQVPLA